MAPTIEITVRHVSVTDSMRDHAMKKIQRTVETFPRLENVHIILDIQKYRQIAEVVVQGLDHQRLEAREESEDMYASIDRVADKIEKRLLKWRDKKVEARQRNHPPSRVEDVPQAEPNA